MATVIDAFVVTLGLDPKDFAKGRAKYKEQLDGLRKDATEAEAEIERVRAASTEATKTQDDARIRSLKAVVDERHKEITEIERGQKAEVESSKRRAEAVNSVRREVVGLVATVMGAKSIKDFAFGMTKSNAQAGRDARVLGVSTEELTAWQGVMEQVGGTAEDATGSLQGLVSTFEQIQLTGQSPLIPYLNLLGISLRDLKDPSETLLKLSDKFSKMDPRLAAKLGGDMGLSPSMVNVLIQGRAATEGMLEAQRKASVIHEKDAKVSAEAQRQMALLRGTYKRLGNDILVDVLPPVTKFGQALTDFSQEYPGVVKGLMEIAGGFVGIRFAILAITGLFGKGAATAVVGGAAGLLARFGPAGAFLTTLLKPTKANEGEDEAVAKAHADEDARRVAAGKAPIWKKSPPPRASERPAVGQAADIIRGFEGFLSTAKWDRNAYRAGFGSDTTTDPHTGQVRRVTKDTAGVTREAAEADLMRRITSEFMPRAAAAVGKAWADLPNSTKAALTSVTYNYGSLPERVAKIARGGDVGATAAAIEALKTDNAGLNAQRRIKEAQLAVGSTPGAALANNDNRVSNSTTTTEIKIGQVTVETKSTDAKGIASEFRDNMARRGVATQGNTGLS